MANKNWVVSKLKDIGKIVSGGTPSTGNRDYWGNEIAWITPADLSGYSSKYISKGRKSISKTGLEHSSAKLVPKNSVLFSSRAPIGYVVIASNDLATNQGFKNIIPNSNIDSLYLYYYLKASKKLAEENASGTTFKEISSSKFGELPIPVPPLDQQQAIVSKLEELFSKLDNGVESLKTLQEQLKVYRQAVLKWAFDGRLTNANLKDGELPEGWEKTKVEDVATVMSGQPFRSETFRDTGKFQVIRIGNVRPGVLRLNEQPVFLDEVEKKILEKSKLEIGDTIITLTGTRNKRDYGFTTIILYPNLLLNQRIAAIRFNEKYLPKFFLYFSCTDEFKNQFFANETGNVGQGNVGMNAVRLSTIPYPHVIEQKKVVEEIESRLSVCDKIEETITNGLKEAEALRQSILKKAFEGKLIWEL